ncbi:hypothetical protein E1267_43120, partial [Nonomuraea longispora]
MTTLVPPMTGFTLVIMARTPAAVCRFSFTPAVLVLGDPVTVGSPLEDTLPDGFPPPDGPTMGLFPGDLETPGSTGVRAGSDCHTSTPAATTAAVVAVNATVLAPLRERRVPVAPATTPDGTLSGHAGPGGAGRRGAEGG